LTVLGSFVEAVSRRVVYLRCILAAHPRPAPGRGGERGNGAGRGEDHFEICSVLPVWSVLQCCSCSSSNPPPS